MKIVVIGCGFVGGTVANFIEKHCKGVSVIRMDPKIEGSPDNVEQLSNINGAIICLNAPTMPDGNVDWQDIKSYINRLTGHFGDMPILLKSTVPLFSNLTTPEYDEIPEHVVYNPEFLTAANAEEDFENQKHFILGVDPRSITHDVPAKDNPHAMFWTNIFAPSLPDAEFVYTDRETAAMVKYTHNAWLATKVTFFHTMSECMPGLSNYNEMVNILAKFTNIGSSHMKIPNSKGELGYEGFCFPKDMAAFARITKGRDLVRNIIVANNELQKLSSRSKLSEVPEEDYIICLGTSHTLGECEGEQVTNYTQHIESDVGLKVVQVGFSGADNLDLLRTLTDLNNRGFLNSRCKLLILEPRITDGTGVIPTDVIVGKDAHLKWLDQNWNTANTANYKSPLYRTTLNQNIMETNPDNGAPHRDLQIRHNPVDLMTNDHLFNMLQEEYNEYDINIKKPDNYDDIMDTAIMNLTEWGKSFQLIEQDLAVVEAIAAIVKNAGVKFRWFMVDDKKQEMDFLRFRFGKQSQIFKELLLHLPCHRMLMPDKTKTIWDQPEMQKYLCKCQHFNEVGWKKVSNDHIVPAVKLALESDNE